MIGAAVTWAFVCGVLVAPPNDAAGRLVWLNHGQTTCDGGSLAQTFGPSTTYTYDDRDRIESVVHRGPPPGFGQPGRVLVSRTYVRNDAGEPTRIIEEDGTYTEVDYDPAGRVEVERYFDAVDTLLETITYGYDLDGNRTGRTSNTGSEVYVYDTGSRLTQVLLDGVETQRFEYDDNGRVTRIVRDGQDQQLTWDALDRLVRIEDVNFLEVPVDYTYDGQGRRVAADRVGASANRYVVGPAGNQSLESPHLVHDGLFLTGELVYNGEHALWRYDGSEPPQTRVYLRDAMGSVIGLMDDDGNLVERFQYDAFGNVRSAGGEALPEVSFGGDSRFQGMWKDAGTGLYYARARYYDARTGRFLSMDPAEGSLETPESFYPYVFANGNPWTGRDPTGLFTLAELSIANSIRLGIADGQATFGLSFIDQLQAARGDVDGVGEGVVRDVATGVAFGAVGAVGIVGINLLRGLRAGVPTRLIIGSGQFGRKVAQRARDLGLDPSSPQVRFQIQNRIQRIFKDRDQVRSGTFRGQGPNGSLGDVLFFVRGQDVVVTTPTGEFVSFLPGGISNSFVQAAKLL